MFVVMFAVRKGLIQGEVVRFGGVGLYASRNAENEGNLVVSSSSKLVFDLQSG
jgi:hypothetical protein